MERNLHKINYHPKVHKIKHAKADKDVGELASIEG